MRALDRIVDMLPEKLAREFRGIDESVFEDIEEVRLRAYGGLSTKINGSEYLVNTSGGLSRLSSDIRVTQEDIRYVLDRALRSSVYSYIRDMTEGFISLTGGFRLGVCGTALYPPRGEGKPLSVRNITSVDIRVPREKKGCADELFRFSGGLKSMLIAGPPGSGKTTYLRDLTRLIGGRYTTAVIDERGEIAGEVGSFDLGPFTDVFSAYGRYDGILAAVRVMSPRVIVCDEIGTSADFEAIEYAINSGVKLIASCHCEGFDELRGKKYIAGLLDRRVFDCCAFLKDKRIAEIRELG